MLIQVKVRKNLLEKQGFKVALTRTNDNFITIQNCTRFANDFGADIFISVHINSLEGNKRNEVSGSETYALTLLNHPSTGRHELQSADQQLYPGNKFDRWNTLLAYSIQCRLINNLSTYDRGLKRARFKVLQDLQCPGVLVESAFISHPDDARRLQSSEFRDNIAASIMDGVLKFDKLLLASLPKSKPNH